MHRCLCNCPHAYYRCLWNIIQLHCYTCLSNDITLAQELHALSQVILRLTQRCMHTHHGWIPGHAQTDCQSSRGFVPVTNFDEVVWPWRAYPRMVRICAFPISPPSSIIYSHTHTHPHTHIHTLTHTPTHTHTLARTHPYTHTHSSVSYACRCILVIFQLTLEGNFKLQHTYDGARA